MTEYRVRWEIDVDADSIVEAAEEARKAQTREGTIANVFQVRPLDDALEARWDVVDLLDETTAVTWEYGHKALFEMAQKLVEDGGDVAAVLEMLEKPQKWPELLRDAALDSAFDAVSPGEDEPDTSEDPAPEVRCRRCGAVLLLDNKGPMSTGHWMSAGSMDVNCPVPSPSGFHEPRDEDLCETCQDPEHEVCSMSSGCRCCAETMAGTS